MPEAQGSANPNTAYERKDAPPALLAGLLGLVAAVTIAAALILSGIFSTTLNERSEAPTRLPPQPRLQVNEAEAMRRFDAVVERQLDNYGWIDRRHGIVHIPITEAMQQAAAAGFPDWPGNPKPATKGVAQNGSATSAKAAMKFTVKKPLFAPSGKPATKAARGAGAAPAGMRGR